MSVWLTIPSARPAAEAERCLKLWRQAGYKIALFLDSGERIAQFKGMADVFQCPQLLKMDGYPGYARAVNSLIAGVMGLPTQAEWFIAAGDDTEPDLAHTAEEIAVQCKAYFHGINRDRGVPLSEGCETVDTWGVMQPTGDRFAGGSIDRIAGSAWLGREFCKRIYGGKGPLWPEFTHMFVDEHLQAVAQKLGIFWQRPDLIHLHHHFMRASDDLNSHAVRREPPVHLVAANSQAHWDQSKAVFERLKAGGFAEANDLLQAEAA